MNPSPMERVNEVRAWPAIEQQVLNERKRESPEEELTFRRDISKIKYRGQFDGAASDAGDAPLVSTASAGLNACDISKGMGPK